MLSSEPTSASCARPAAGPDDPDRAARPGGPAGQVAAVAVAAVATVNAPAAIRAAAWDRLHLILPCRDKGTFRWFACHASCFTLDRNCPGNGGRHLLMRLARAFAKCR